MGYFLFVSRYKLSDTVDIYSISIYRQRHEHFGREGWRAIAMNSKCQYCNRISDELVEYTEGIEEMNEVLICPMCRDEATIENEVYIDNVYA